MPLKSTRLRMIIITAYACTIMPGLAAAQHVSTNINKAVRLQWIQGAAAFLKTVKPEPPVKQVEIHDLKHFERDQLACTLSAQCYIRINETNWIFFILHSAHSNPEVGDLILAIDQNGELYHSDAHVCGGTSSLRTHDLVMPISSTDFFARFLSRGSGDGRWTKLNLQ